MLEGLVAAGFFVCFYGGGKFLLVGAGAMLFTEAARLSFVPAAAPPVFCALWLVLAGRLFRENAREEVFLAGGLWLMARTAAGLVSGTSAVQTALMTALFAMLFLGLLNRQKAHLLWAVVLFAMWLITGFFESVAYPQEWQRQIMALCLYFGMGAVLICQQVFCARSRAERRWEDFTNIGISGKNETSPSLLQNSLASLQEAASREYRRLQIFEHDFRHHLAMVGALYEQGDAAGARAYMEDLEQARQSHFGKRLCGERELALLMYAKKEECRQAQIDFSYQILGSPAGIAQMDMTALLLNLLDNAIRACKTVQGQRCITMMLLARGEFWQIELTNSGRYEPAGQKEVQPQKTGRPLHGIGMVSVAQIVEKYHGSSRIYHEQDRVVQKFILTQREL